MRSFLSNQWEKKFSHFCRVTCKRVYSREYIRSICLPQILPVVFSSSCLRNSWQFLRLFWQNGCTMYLCTRFFDTKAKHMHFWGTSKNWSGLFRRPNCFLPVRPCLSKPWFHLPTLHGSQKLPNSFGVNSSTTKKKPFFWFLNKLGDELQFRYEWPHRQHNALVQFVAEFTNSSLVNRP